MEKIYNKLIRDSIPEIIKKDGGTPLCRVLEDKEYKQELERKFLEEYNEIISAKNSDERIEELADVLEILISLAKIENKSLNDIIEIADFKREKRGSFEKKIFLEKVIY